MPNIVAGRFEQQADARAAVAALQRAGFGQNQVTSFFVNPPGQHAQFAVGGDRAASPGAKTAGVGAAAGAAVGGVVVGLGVGLAATTVVGPAAVPAAAGVGAYVGALAGALGKMEDSPAQEHPLAEEQPDIRHAGFVVAAHAPDDEQRARALAVLQSSGAKDIETADGHWRDGKWTDFDPVAAPGTEGKPVVASTAEK